MRILLDAYCVNCGDELSYKELSFGICTECLSNITLIDSNLSCRVCGLPDSSRKCSFCESNRIFVDRNISLFVYKGLLKDIVHQIKFSGQKHLVQVLNYKIGRINVDELFMVNIDIIIPVPTSIKSVVERGFDFVKMIFLPIAKANGKRYISLLGRKLFQKEQKKLSKDERASLVKKRFYLRNLVDLSGKNVLIVDDVFTTGSTINASAELIRELNPKSVFSLTLVRVLREL
ncbi:MAG: phosphoribosyltransferase family protein [Brevinematales bacterium]|nr:phosphoribosyltransferase family protein [Brevinematales bacterium]